mmetsp:Transcript_45988/g.144072  ORF Transcript_45988/g.144072 Transcript_45988/m.144072 type:complete len:509 (-) Transcript_45988:13-1539(-)
MRGSRGQPHAGRCGGAVLPGQRAARGPRGHGGADGAPGSGGAARGRGPLQRPVRRPGPARRRVHEFLLPALRIRDDPRLRPPGQGGRPGFRHQAVPAQPLRQALPVVSSHHPHRVRPHGLDLPHHRVSAAAAGPAPVQLRPVGAGRQHVGYPSERVDRRPDLRSLPPCEPCVVDRADHVAVLPLLPGPAPLAAARDASPRRHHGSVLAAAPRLPVPLRGGSLPHWPGLLGLLGRTGLASQPLLRLRDGLRHGLRALARRRCGKVALHGPLVRRWRAPCGGEGLGPARDLRLHLVPCHPRRVGDVCGARGAAGLRDNLRNAAACVRAHPGGCRGTGSPALRGPHRRADPLRRCGARCKAVQEPRDAEDGRHIDDVLHGAHPGPPGSKRRLPGTAARVDGAHPLLLLPRRGLAVGTRLRGPGPQAVAGLSGLGPRCVGEYPSNARSPTRGHALAHARSLARTRTPAQPDAPTHQLWTPPAGAGPRRSAFPLGWARGQIRLTPRCRKDTRL